MTLEATGTLETAEAPARLLGRGLQVGYGSGRRILHDIDVLIPDGELTVIVGPNACGKSTLLKTLARMLPPERGEVLLDGRPIRSYQPKAAARRLGLLPRPPPLPTASRCRISSHAAGTRTRTCCGSGAPTTSAP